VRVAVKKAVESLRIQNEKNEQEEAQKFAAKELVDQKVDMQCVTLMRPC
jgi:hypothetical protein